MAIPNLPVFFDMKYTEESGKLTSDAFLHNDNMWQSLNNAVFLLNSIVASTIDANNNITNDIFFFPKKTTAEITAFGNDLSISVGAAWFDTDDAKLKVKTAAGMIKTVQYEP
jgi:hypothetical protein